ncbi:hypothetical protein CJ030_MR2G013145 [Morella rubra]|uniref:Uncharacterized protein n=1 Tax=Morella rubra TaxID=262757 RepID=A0A6A1W885_9ROSI|nr:hypothetical protein CJ030_MR2G013145 [Morella rubra]
MVRLKRVAAKQAENHCGMSKQPASTKPPKKRTEASSSAPPPPKRFTRQASGKAPQTPDPPTDFDSNRFLNAKAEELFTTRFAPKLLIIEREEVFKLDLAKLMADVAFMRKHLRLDDASSSAPPPEEDTEDVEEEEDKEEDVRVEDDPAADDVDEGDDEVEGDEDDGYALPPLMMNSFFGSFLTKGE